jgi:hypothetical protein
VTIVRLVGITATATTTTAMDCGIPDHVLGEDTLVDEVLHNLLHRRRGVEAGIREDVDIDVGNAGGMCALHIRCDWWRQNQWNS